MIERLSGLALLGSTLIVCALFGLSIWIIARTVERYSFFRTRKDDIEGLGEELVARLRQGDFGGVDRVLAQSPSIEAALLRPALEWLDAGPDAVEEVINAKSAGNRRELERSLLPLGIIGRQAPWVGGFGAIMGLIGTLHQLEKGPGNFTSTLAHGISLSLLPAAAGIVVGVAASIAHSTLFDEVLNVDVGVGILSKRLLALLRFKGTLAREFGLTANGLGRTSLAASSSTNLEDDAERPRSVTELD